MPKCPKCGALVPEGQPTCVTCGTKLKILSDEITAHINLLQKKIETDPRNATLHLDLAELYNKHEFTNEALAEYQKVISIDGNNYDANIKSAFIFLGLKELEKTENAFRQALHINPKSTESLVGLFRAYHLQKKTEEAIVVGEKIVKALPDKPEFYRTLKELYLRKGDREKVLMAMQKLESLVPGDVQIVKEIADFHRKNNNIQKATEYYQKVIILDPNDIETSFQVAKLYHDNNEYDRVIETLGKLLEKTDLRPEQGTMIRCYLGLAYFHKGDASRAKSLAEKIQTTVPLTNQADRKTVALLLYKIGQRAYESKKLNPAIIHLGKAVQFDPEAADAIALLQKAQASVQTVSRSTVKKSLIGALSVVGGIALVLLLWHFSHNKIRIEIQPAEEAKIFVDGKIISGAYDEPGMISSPSLMIGKHHVVVEKNGFEKWQGYVNIGFGRQAKIHVELVPIYFSLKVNSSPESASVYLDNNYIGKTPFSSDRMLAYPHEIEVNYNGYAPWRGKLTITKNDIADLGTIYLRNLAGKWRGKIGDDAYFYNASFTMEIRQKGAGFSLNYTHRPSEDRFYTGEIKGWISKNEFSAEGDITYKYLNVFYWAKAKKKLTIKGKISDDWNRIEGTHQVEGLGSHSWWANREASNR